MIDNSKFKSFFKIHSENVDNSNNQGFWKITDEVMKTYILENSEKKDNITLVDFGGGTGRWLGILDKHFTNSKFIIVDLSPDMLEKAQEKINKGLYKNEVQLIESNIENIPLLNDNTADIIISTYNPLSFVNVPQNVVNEAYRILKPDGVAMITSQAYYNALYSKINNYLADRKELEYIRNEKKLKWNDFVPETWQLSKQDLESMYEKAGFKNIFSRGIATIIQPQNEDWDQTNNKLGPLSSKLNDDEDFFNSILELELDAGRDEFAVNRAMNIMVLGKK